MSMTDLLPLALLAVGLIVTELTVVVCRRYLKYRDARVRQEAHKAALRRITDLAWMLPRQDGREISRTFYDEDGRQN